MKALARRVTRLKILSTNTPCESDTTTLINLSSIRAIEVSCGEGSSIPEYLVVLAARGKEYDPGYMHLAPSAMLGGIYCFLISWHFLANSPGAFSRHILAALCIWRGSIVALLIKASAVLSSVCFVGSFGGLQKAPLDSRPPRSTGKRVRIKQDRRPVDEVTDTL